MKKKSLQEGWIGIKVKDIKKAIEIAEKNGLTRTTSNNPIEDSYFISGDTIFVNDWKNKDIVKDLENIKENKIMKKITKENLVKYIKNEIRKILNESKQIIKEPQVGNTLHFNTSNKDYDVIDISPNGKVSLVNHSDKNDRKDFDMFQIKFWLKQKTAKLIENKDKKRYTLNEAISPGTVASVNFQVARQYFGDIPKYMKLLKQIVEKGKNHKIEVIEDNGIDVLIRPYKSDFKKDIYIPKQAILKENINTQTENEQFYVVNFISNGKDINRKVLAINPDAAIKLSGANKETFNFVKDENNKIVKVNLIDKKDRLFKNK